MSCEHRSHSDRAVARVMSWAEFYTSGLPEGVRIERLEEVLSDLHEHALSRTAAPSSDRTLAREILGRSIRGATADISWRRVEVRKLRFGRATRATRAALAVTIAAGAIATTMCFVGSNAESSAASEASVQIGYLDDQVHGEALFLVPLAGEDAQYLYYAKYVTTDPVWAEALPGMEEGALGEYVNLRGLLSQLASEQRHAAKSNSAAQEEAILGACLGGTGAALLVGFVFVLWFEPRPPRPSAKSPISIVKS